MASANINPEHVTAWSFRSAGAFDADQSAALEKFQGNLATGLGHALSEALQVPIELAAAGVERCGLRPWLQQRPGPAYLVPAAVEGDSAHVLLHIDTALALAFIDVALGGPGDPAVEVRQPTEIEEPMLASLGAQLARVVEANWPLEPRLKLTLQARQDAAGLYPIMPPDERMLVLGFSVKCGKVSGALHWALPAEISFSLLRALVTPAIAPRTRGADAGVLQRQRMRAARFPLELELPPARLPMRHLLELRVGHVLTLPQTAECAAEVRVSGKILFEAQPIRRGHNRAALIQAQSDPAEPTEVLEP